MDVMDVLILLLAFATIPMTVGILVIAGCVRGLWRRWQNRAYFRMQDRTEREVRGRRVA